MGLWSLRFLTLLGIVLVFILAAAYFFYGLQPSFANDNPVEFRVAKGESFRAIGARLSQESLIRSIAVFKIYSIFTGNIYFFDSYYWSNRSLFVGKKRNKKTLFEAISECFLLRRLGRLWRVDPCQSLRHQMSLCRLREAHRTLRSQARSSGKRDPFPAHRL